MNNTTYECDLEWLKCLINGTNSNSGATLGRPAVKWQKFEDVVVVEGARSTGTAAVTSKAPNVTYRMMVWVVNVYKGWIEVRWCSVRKRFGLYAVTRFEKGSIVTAKVPTEERLTESSTPSLETLNLGWNWAITKKGRRTRTYQQCDMPGA
jgi:hypothetical protein